MKFLIIFVLALTAVSAFRIDVHEEDSALEQNDINGRIINGDRATLGQFRYYVSITMRISDTSQAFCGGSLIKENWVMTAAHCMDIKFINMTLRFGSIYRIIGGIEVNIQNDQRLNNIYIYPDWNSALIRHDIALIRIPPIVTSAYIGTVNLPPNGSLTYAGEVGIASGCGKAKDNGGVSDVLLYAPLKIIPNFECQNHFGTYVTSGNICTNQTNKQSPCSGDSGGPLVVNDTQVGIVSFGGIPCQRDQPTVFTRTSEYKGWIDSVTSF